MTDYALQKKYHFNDLLNYCVKILAKFLVSKIEVKLWKVILPT